MSRLIKDKVILGIDPGTNLMGYGVLHIQDSKPHVVTLGVIDLRKYANHYLKLGHIHERVRGIIESFFVSSSTRHAASLDLYFPFSLIRL